MMVLSQQDPRSVFGPQSITQLDSNITYLKEGFIFSSKAFLKNIQLMFGVMGNEFTLYLDGTYKITNEGWVLLVLGTHSVTIGQRVTHSLRPFMCCWTYSENAVAVTALLKYLKRTALQIVGLHIAVVSIDHCEAFYNAITDDGTNDTMVVDCYAHMIRNIRDNNGNRLKKVNIPAILAELDILCRSPSPEAFNVLMTLALARWENDLQELEFVTYFRTYYLGKWANWFISATPFHELGVTTNSVESFNRHC